MDRFVTDDAPGQHPGRWGVDSSKHERLIELMRADELDFHLPPELIAQTPSADRAASRLLHYRMRDRSIEHRRFSDLAALLRPDDLLVMNDARVIPARFMLRKSTGGRIEGLFLHEESPGTWRAMLRGVGSPRPELALQFADAPELHVRVIEKREDGQYLIAISSGESALSVLSRLGRMPLPPYIKRDREQDERDPLDRARYQTIYASAPGSVAAPTAGLHFTQPLLEELSRRGIERATVTLHVGLGTFKPISTQRLDDHAMHTEAYSIAPDAADALNRAVRASRRIVAVGTTSARVLESQTPGEPFTPHEGETSIFIRPGYAWKHVGALITNFHLPRSTLIALVAAKVGLAEQRRIYAEAIAQRYRFFSYGDAMLIDG
jgi:S-adenosylmethionine:tRNA ribosyltransferase-isomerase